MGRTNGRNFPQPELRIGPVSEIEWNEIDQRKSHPGVLMLKLEGDKVAKLE